MPGIRGMNLAEASLASPCPPQKKISRRRLKRIFMMKAAKNRPCSDLNSRRDVVSMQLSRDRHANRGVWKTRAQSSVRPCRVEVLHPLRQNPVQMPLTDRDQIVQAFPANRADGRFL